MLRSVRSITSRLLVIAMATGSIVPVFAADDAAAPTGALEQAPEDVSDRVRVDVVGTLLSTVDGVLFTGVVVENISTDDLAGRLVVVVDETGIEGLTIADNDGALESGERFVQVLPKSGILKPDAKTPSQRVEFTSPERVSAALRRTFSPKFRVLRADPAPESQPAADELLPGKSYSQARLDAVMQIQQRATAQLLQTPGVFGTAVSEDDQGNLVVRVFTQRHGIIKQLPGTVEGVPLDQKVTGGSFRAGPAWTKVIDINGQKRIGGLPPKLTPTPDAPQAGTLPIPTDPTIRFDRPVPIGVSLFDQSDTVCASGTLGCRVVFQDGRLGILTNSHVGAQESAVTARAEDPINRVVGDQWSQPGCGDAGGDIQADIIATLVDFQNFSLLSTTNQIDAAVGRINTPNRALVMACTPPDGYGFPSRTPKAPRIGMRVHKFGRTTGYRQGTIEGINAIAVVAYSRGILTFNGQLDIYGDNFAFGAPGDSGSLIVTEQGNHPVGLLFAGSGFEVLGNPIQPVLHRFKIAVDDGTETPPDFSGERTDGRMGNSGGKVPSF